MKAKDRVIFTRASRESTPEEYTPLQTYNHITVANWMDDVRANSYDKAMGDWHYIGKPFFDGVPVKLAVPNSPNVRTKIAEYVRTLQKVRNFDRSDKEHAK